MAAAISLVLTGTFVQLAKRAGWGKAVRSQGPESHLAKAGTPTMAGVAFLVAALVTWLLLGGDALVVLDAHVPQISYGGAQHNADQHIDNQHDYVNCHRSSLPSSLNAHGELVWVLISSQRRSTTSRTVP